MTEAGTPINVGGFYPYPFWERDEPDEDGFLRFVEVMLRMQQIPASDQPGAVNLAQHSYRVTIVALYLLTVYPRKFKGYDLYQTLIYALFHRFGEAQDPAALHEKFPEFHDLASWIKSYQLGDCPESLIVAQLSRWLLGITPGQRLNRHDSAPEYTELLRGVNLRKLMRFIDLTYDLQKVVRLASLPGRMEYEDDVEHSYHVAVATLYITTAYTSRFWGFNRLRVIIEALLHDLVEVYAGDVAWGQSTIHKHKKEKRAWHRLRFTFREFRELARWIDRYEQKTSQESWLVFSVDKLVASAIIYLSGGHSWQASGQTSRVHVRTMVEKFFSVRPIPIILQIFTRMMSLYGQDYDRFAPPSKEGE